MGDRVEKKLLKMVAVRWHAVVKGELSGQQLQQKHTHSSSYNCKTVEDHLTDLDGYAGILF